MRENAPEEARRWLEQAEADLHWTEHLAEEGGYHLACFLAQQVAEKALKAFLYGQGEEIVLGHSVERLCDAARRYDEDFADLGRELSLLDGYYLTTRYPNSLPGGIPSNVYNASAAREAAALAKKAVDAVRTKLGKLGT